MNTLETLIERNHDFAQQQFTSGLPLMPTLRTMIVSCADPRVDPGQTSRCSGLSGCQPSEESPGRKPAPNDKEAR